MAGTQSTRNADLLMDDNIPETNFGGDSDDEMLIVGKKKQRKSSTWIDDEADDDEDDEFQGRETLNQGRKKMWKSISQWAN